ncbi:AAA family ATPase [Amycolatopsis sp. lyj-108]|uniref:AAA family ATPase n=1 Tax=Amycolatopsis sp. lyj-108 TaxID=2789286 RepID=UPI00397B8D11
MRQQALDALGWITRTAPRIAAGAVAGGWRYCWGPLWRDAATGARWMGPRLAAYLAASVEYAGVIAEAAENRQALTVAKLRRERRRTIARRLIGAAVIGVLGWLMLAGWAAQRGPLVWPLAGALVVAVFAVVGRFATRREERTTAEVDKAKGAPFPIADAHTRAEAADAVARAVTAEGVRLRGTEAVRREPWGWHVAVILAKGTPADLLDKLTDLETVLDLPAGGVMATPAHTRRARVDLRLAIRDPFAGLPPVDYRAPGSASITRPLVIARRMDGTDLAVTVEGAHVVVIGVPGAGKTTALRALVDALTACGDVLVWDLDPAGAGLDIFGEAVDRRARSPRDIERLLTYALAYALARPSLLHELGMGDAWQPSPDRPALVLVIDEFPLLSDRAKALAVRLLRVGRKARVSIVLASHEATTDALGAAIASSVAVRIMLAARNVDVPQVLGPTRLAEGWRPDRLAIPEDAGKAFIFAPGSRDPLVSKIRTVDRDHAARVGAERAAHGLPVLDADTIAAAARLAVMEDEPEDAPVIDGRAVVDILGVFDNLPRLHTVDLLTRLATLDTRYREWTPETLASVLRPLEITPTGVKVDGVNRNGYVRAEISAAWRAWRAGERP